jgi:PAS domain S-box-containing protein
MGNFTIGNLKLSSKGWILVGVPLAFELVFIAVLLCLLRNADQARLQEIRSQAILAEAQTIQSKYYTAGSALFAYGLSKQSPFYEQRFRKLIAEIGEDIDNFEQLLEHDRKSPDEIRRLDTLAKQSLDLLRLSKAEIDNSEAPDDILVHKPNRLLEPLLTQFTDQLERVVAPNKKYAKHYEQAQKESSNALYFSVTLALIANIGLAFWLAAFFNQSTRQRLMIIFDNAVRMGQNKPLLPALPGDDEIAYVDHAFHNMSSNLAEARRKERIVVDHALDVICSFDEQGNCLTTNHATKNIFGYEPRDFVGINLRQLIVEEDLGAMETALQDLKHNLARGTFENRIRSKNGEDRDVLWSIHWSQAESSFFCVAHDSTDRKEIERLKKQFIEMLSHDLRAPLSSLQILLSMLEMGVYGQVTDKGKDRIQSCGLEIGRLIGLINDLLDIEKMEAGKMEMHCEPTSIETAITRAVESIRELAQTRQITFRTDLTHLNCFADKDRLVQVLVNLIGNAVKFSPDGGEITISASKAEDSVEVRITDLGRGIAKEHQTTLFQRFHQLERSDAISKGGSGLGLAVCRAIIEQLQGSIGVDSEVGRGSTFWFKLPLAGDTIYVAQKPEIKATL